MPQFVRLELWSNLQCNGGAKLAVLYPDDLIAAGDIRAIDDVENLTFSFERYDRTDSLRPIVSALVMRSIATVVWDDGSFDEWRVAIIDDSRGLNTPITVTANPLIQDLAQGADSSTGKGLVSTVTGPLRVFDFALTSQSPSSIWSTYVIPACPSWVAAGTIDPTTLIPTLSWTRVTPLALAIQVRDTLRKMNVSCEVQLRRNGTTNYLLDLVTQIGSAATVPLFYPTVNMRSIKRRFDTTQQATRVFVTGETDPSTLASIPGRARWTVTNVDGVNKKLTLADPNGGSGPIGMTDQFKNLWILRTSTKGTFQIQGSDPAAQTVALLSVSTIVVGETVELRYSEPGTNTLTIANPNTRYSISAVGGSSVTLSGGPITVTNQLVDWYLRVWTLSSGGSIVGTFKITSTTTGNVIGNFTPTGVTTSHVAEFIQLDGAGELPSYLDHATAVQAPPTGYGMKAANLNLSTIVGVPQLVPNAWMRTWTNSGNPPDGWSQSGGGSPSQNSNTAFIRYGPFSYHLTGAGPGMTVMCPITPLSWAPGNTRASIRCNVYVAANGVVGTGPSLQLSLVTLTPTGSAGTQIGATIVLGPSPAIGWATMQGQGFDVGAQQSPYGLGIRLVVAGSIGDTIEIYVDTMEMYPYVSNPAEVFEFGDVPSLHQTANRYLVAFNTPPITYDAAVADLERAGLATVPLTLGGNVRAVDPELSIDTTVRLLRRERPFLTPEDSTITLSNLPLQLLQLVQS